MRRGQLFLSVPRGEASPLGYPGKPRPPSLRIGSRGQLFVVDIMLALVVIVLAIGLVTNAWSWHLQQQSASVEHAKMQQIAIDAAALEYYTGGYSGLDTGAGNLGYIIGADDTDANCISSMRGTGAKQVGVFVCRGE